MRPKNLIVFVIFITIFFSCKKNDTYTNGCPMFDIVPSSPYNDPVWHPSGKLIGFNHTPIKEIQYIYGYDCPCQARYIYENDSVGFWLIDSDGKNQRMVLPYELTTPAWSPDGNWIAFSEGAQIFKMPFDGTHFDTTAIVQLTFEGRNFFPTWSPDGQWIAYDAFIKDKNKFYAIRKMKYNGEEKTLITIHTTDEGDIRMPNWGNLGIVHIRYIGVGFPEIFTMDSTGNNVIRITENDNMDNYPKYSPDNRFICYISQSKSGRGTQLWRFNTAINSFKQLTTTGAINFSWSPKGRIVYLNFDYSRIDDTKGTLWVIDSDGSNKQQLTHNSFKIT